MRLTAEFTSDNVYTVTLKEGLTFANGNELTSEDVKHTFDRQLAIADPNGPSSLLGNLEKVEAVDELTVEFHLKEPGDQTFPYVLCSPAGPIVDAEVFPADAVLSDAEIVDAMKLIWKHLRIVMEPSSAVPLAAILKNRDAFAGKRVGIIITGGNVDLDKLPWI